MPAKRAIALALALIFAATTPALATGTPTVTTIDSIRPGAESSSALDISEAVAMGDWLYFSANDGSNGEELWRTNGDITQLVKDIATGAGGSSPQHFAQFEGNLYFSADDGVHGRELWRTDGTSAGTTAVHDLVWTPNLIPAAPELENTFYSVQLRTTAITAGVATISVHVYDYTSDPAANARIIVTDQGSSAVLYDTTFGDYGMFESGGSYTTTFTLDCSATVSIAMTAVEFSSAKIYVGSTLLDEGGTFSGNNPAATINGSVCSEGSIDPVPLGVANGLLFVQGSDGIHGQELWATDGTSLTLERDINVGTGSSGISVGDVASYAGYLYFSADDGINDTELWRSNGTTTEVVVELSTDANPSNLTVFSASNLLYFAANYSAPDASPGRELYRTNGALSTNLGSDVYSGTGSSNITELTEFNGSLYFSAIDADHGRELWKFDGTTSTLVTDINPTSYSDPYALTPMGAWLYFAANDGTTGYELYRTSGTTTELVADLNATGDSDPARLTPLGNQLYFHAYEPTFGDSLYRTDGVTTQRVTLPGATTISCDCWDTALVALGSRLFTTVSSASIGQEFGYLDEPSAMLPETSQRPSSMSLTLTLFASLLAVAGVALSFRSIRAARE